MVTTLKQGSSLDTIKKALKELSKKRKKGLDAQLFCGVITLNEDPLEIQRQLRDEWK